MANKFELATSGMTIRFFNLVPGNEDKAVSLVKYLVLSAQYEKLVKKLPIENFNNLHPGVDFFTADEAMFEGLVDKTELPALLETRDNALFVQKGIDLLPYGLDAWNALSEADKRFLQIEAHKTVSSIVIPKAVFDGAGLKEAIKKFYGNASRKDVISALRPLFYKVCGQGGEMFTGLSFTRTDFKTSDVLNFLAAFGGSAKRAEKKDKDGVVTVGSYDYVDKSGNKRTMQAALTTWLGVIMESRKDSYCKVIRG